jgi:hypothetical protein
MQSQTFEASTTVQQQWTILTGVTHVSILAVNTGDNRVLQEQRIDENLSGLRDPRSQKR